MILIQYYNYKNIILSFYKIGLQSNPYYYARDYVNCIIQ